MELLSFFENLVKNLFVMSETDAPLTPFFWETQETITAEMIAKKSEKSELEKSPIEKVDFNAFFEKYTTKEDWYGEDELAVVTQFENLKKGLEEKLSELEVYRIGKINIDVFILGKLINAEKIMGYAGLKTFVVET